MGGKPKQAQRTKGNLKPSKSSNFNTDPAPLLSFTPVDSALLQSSLVAGFNVEEIVEIDPNIDQNFQVVLRKMCKKDPTTKIKALKEFIDLTNESELDVVLTAILMYAKVYNQLSTEVDARVRESCQLSLLTIVNKIGKNLATILKQIFPSWICAQYDTHPTAASIAKNSFNKAFPPNKVSEVFSFCESEVLDNFIKNLTVLNPQTICNSKVYSSEECEAKYERVVIGSLRGYINYLEKIPSDKIEKSLERNSNLVAHDKFWSFHKNKSPYIRAAFFEALTSILQHSPILMKNLEPQLTSTVFKMLDESEPSVLSHIWTSILLVQLKVEDWHSHININKMLLPKLWKILRTCLYPCIIYPNLLPLVSKFNKTILPDDQLQNFYLKFFENINEGLRTVQLSKSELSTVASTYFEILQYIIIQIINDTEQNDEEKLIKVNSLIDDHIIAVIYWCINSDSLFGKVVFSKISEIIKHWSKNIATKDIYSKIFDRFWIELYQVLEGSLENSNLQQISNGHVELIKNLKTTTSKPKGVKIKVEDDPIEQPEVVVITEKVKDISFDGPLCELVYKLSLSYVEKINTTLDKNLVENLDIMIKEYQSKELFKHLASNQEDKSICSLYDTFAEWLQNEELKCEAVIEIILALYKYLEPSEKIDLLNRWIRIPIIQKNWLIMRALSYPLCCDAGITKFLKMKEVTDYLSECATNVSNGSYKDNLIILQKCFFQTENGDILIDNLTCGSIIDIICNTLTDSTKINQVDQCASFLAQIFSTICSDPTKKDIQLKIFLSLFDFSITKEVSDNFSEDTMWEISTSWQDALSSGDLEMNDELLGHCSKVINTKLSTSTIADESIENVERFAELVSKLVLCSNEDKQGNERDEAINSMLKVLLNQENIYEDYLEDLCLSIKSIRGDKTFEERTLLDSNNVNFNDALDSHLKYKIFSLNVILMLSCNIKKKQQQDKSSFDDDDSEIDNHEIDYSVMKQQEIQDEEITEDYCDLNENLLKEWKEVVMDKFFDISISSEAILNTFLLHIRKMNPNLENWILYTQERLKVYLIENLPESIQNEIKDELFGRIMTKGEFYVDCLPLLLCTKAYNNENGKAALYNDILSLVNSDEVSLTYINILQTFEKVLDKKFMSITSNLAEKCFNYLLKVSAASVFIRNHLDVSDFNELIDRMIIGHGLILMNEIINKNKENPFLLYNKDVSLEDPNNVLTVSAIANFMSECLLYFPTEIDVKRWDFIRIALSSWILSVSKSCEKFNNETVKNFIVAIFRLNASLQKFIVAEKIKSSTEFLSNMIEEWENVFAKDVNLVLIKSFIYIVKNIDYSSKHHEVFVDALCPHIEYIDFSYVLQGKKIDHTFSLDNLVEFSLENLSSKHNGISITAATIIRQLTDGFLKFDLDTLNKKSSEEYNESEDDEENLENFRWHILESFRDTLESYQEIMKDLSEDFSFKANDMEDDIKIPSEVALPYLLLWHCILNFCSKARPELRTVYARWISMNKYEEVFLFSLFKMMPREILKNPDISTKLGHTAFSTLDWKDIQDSKIDIERYSAFLYGESLRVVPAIVRKWWHACSTRQAQVIDKLTANYVSPILCNEDLTVLTNMKEREGRNSMNIRVLMQAREVIATYSLEEAKMELVVCLPQNYPLGAIKVDCKKHIGGKFQAREIVKQLSIYLTHQNGRLYDGIFIWKRNLDGKYEGVEECYVCYSVIHQENLQLPRNTCKTCKKKFHSSCLYRWFTSSNKSTCPLCRNPF
ncbi:hypothetical protein ACKWTF_009198 [Chironomus riparius]